MVGRTEELALRHDFDGDTGSNRTNEFGGVPVRESKTAVGTCPRYILGFRCAMNAVALKRKTDPSSSDGIVRSRRKDQLISDALLLRNNGQDFGVKGVVWVGSDIGYGQGQVGNFGFIGGNGAGKTGHDLVICIESEEGGFGNHNDDS